MASALHEDNYLIGNRLTSFLRYAGPMNAPNTNIQIENAGSVIRAWRNLRGLSQMNLALDAEVSPRHLSFIETGRAKPSRDMILKLAGTLDMSHADIDRALLAAGFSSQKLKPADAPAQSPAVGQALQVILKAHEPWSAFAFDRTFTLIDFNNAAAATLALMLGEEKSRQPGLNLMRLMFEPEGFRPFLKNFDEVAAHLLRRLARDAAREPFGGPCSDLLQEFGGMALADHDGGDSLVLPITMVLGDAQLNLISTITTLGAPLDAASAEIAIETFLPADDETAALLTALAG
ncbi:MAG: helix-turn-helix domain-containing protein [Alphaproteobacteria bacterium]